MTKVKYDGKVILERDVGLFTSGEIRAHLEKLKLVREGRRPVYREGADTKLLDQMPSDAPLAGDTIDIKSIPGGTIKGTAMIDDPTAISGSRKAEDVRARYIKSQVAAVAEVLGERYGQTVQLDRELRFAVLPRFKLPRRWGMKTTPILIWFPPTYPNTPPNGFYLSANCRGPHIFSRNPFGDSPDLSTYGWNWYCVHPEGWLPSADPLEADNLWTLLDVIRTTLSVDEF
jgi:hypothetical protein